MRIKDIIDKLNHIRDIREDYFRIKAGGCFQYYMCGSLKYFSEHYSYFNQIKYYGSLGFIITITDLRYGFNPMDAVIDYIIKEIELKSRNIKDIQLINKDIVIKTDKKDIILKNQII